LSANRPRVVLIGHPNVGKSQLFNLLTGKQVAVSNYPGTTVELACGKGMLGSRKIELIDSPGLYSLSAISPEEQVTRMLLLKERPALVINILDARNISRMLSLTLELIEADLPLLLVVNMIDEAEAAGLSINGELLSKRLGIPVVCTALTVGRGLKQLSRAASDLLGGDGCRSQKLNSLSIYQPALKSVLSALSSQLKGRYGLSPVAVAAALFNPDRLFLKEMEKQKENQKTLLALINRRSLSGEPLLLLAAARRQQTSVLLKGVIKAPIRERGSLAENLNQLLLSPVGGAVVLLMVLYFGFYRFVGVFGAGTLVELLEQRFYAGLIIPRLNTWAELFIPWVWLQELLVREYGVLTLGFRYAFTIILPIIATYFLLFSLAEDSGYLPRAAYLLNNLMEKIGLNGKAVIPLVLGLGCGTLAVMATRTLESRRDRFQAALLISLAIPCSAQLGLILAVLARSTGLFIWLLVIMLSFFGASVIGKLFWDGKSNLFCLEIPPLRLPRLGAIFRKTYARLRWYLLEVLPIFLVISVLIWFMRLSGLMVYLNLAFRPLLAFVGLPAEAAPIFVVGFLRRDYGAAGLYDLFRSGVLDSGQALVLAVVLTLFLPCVAQLTVLIKELGAKFAGLVLIITALVAWLAGYLVYLLISVPFIEKLI